MKKYIFLIITSFTSSMLFNSCKKEKSVLAEAKFTFSGDLVAIPTQIQFTNNSYGISYVWDFGDGISSNEKNPIHTFNEYGLYKVKLTAKGSNNIDTLVKDLLIGGNLGQIGSLNCGNSTSTTQFKIAIKTRLPFQLLLGGYLLFPSRCGAWPCCLSQSSRAFIFSMHGCKCGPIVFGAFLLI